MYVPRDAIIDNIIRETDVNDVKTFRVVFPDDPKLELFPYKPGQFAEVSVFGIGEAPISITSSPTQEGYLEFSIKKAGVVTTALHYSEAGKHIGVRGPYGNWFDVDSMEGKDLVFIGGGIGLAPLRSLITYTLDERNRKKYGEITIIYGARTPGDLVFKWELEKWAQRNDIKFYLTVDRANGDWQGRVGFVPAVLMDVSPNPSNSISITCGPPIMIKFVIANLEKLGFKPEQIVTTLEMRMKCGIGKCGRCNIGSKYVCRHGPVFTWQELSQMPQEY